MIIETMIRADGSISDAITYPEAGFPLTARQARNNAAMATIAAEFPDTAAVFFPDGRPPGAGSMINAMTRATSGGVKNSPADWPLPSANLRMRYS